MSTSPRINPLPWARLACLAPVLLVAQGAAAQVFKCTDASGKSAYAQTPCGPSTTEKTLRGATGAPAQPVAMPPLAKTPAQATSTPGMSQPGGPAKNGAPLERRLLDIPNRAPGPTDAQIVADCEAQRGARCSSPAEIKRRRFEKHEESSLKGLAR